MNPERELLEQERDQALRDIIDLEQQIAEGEIPDHAAQRMLRHYEATAARTIDALETAQAAERNAAVVTPRRSRATIVVYVAASVAAVLAVVVLLPRYVATRPDGGFVTGNEVTQPEPRVTATPGDPPTPLDLSTMSEAELEAAIVASPNALGLRLALANRYVENGQYDKATEHYGVALKQEPLNPEVQAHAGWLLLKLGNPDAALAFVDRALTIDPGSTDALWFKANILLDGRNDAAGALAVLRTLAGRGDLAAGLRAQVDQLITRAEQASGR